MKSKIVVISILVSIVLLIGTTVNAVQGTVNISGETEVKPGDSVTITLTVKAGSDGVDGLVSNLSYSDGLELKTSGVLDNDIFVMDIATALKEGETKTVNVTFKVKDDAKSGDELTITFGDIRLTNTEEAAEVKLGTKTHKITIKDTVQNPDIKEPEVKEEKKEAIEEKEQVQEESAKKDVTIANKPIEKAGLEMVTIPLIIALIVISVISYKKYKNV